MSSFFNLGGGAGSDYDPVAAADARTNQALGTATPFDRSLLSQGSNIPAIQSRPLDAFLGGGGEVTRAPTSGVGNLDAAFNALLAGGGQAALDGLNNSTTSLLARLGFVGGAADQSRQLLQQSAALQQRGLGLDRQELGIGRGAANRELGSIARLLGFNDQTLLTQIAGVNNAEDTAIRGIRQDATARGAFTSPGTRDSLSDAEKEAELRRQAATISHGETAEGLNMRRGSAQDTLKRLDLAGKRLDLSSEQINNSLNEGLVRLGLDQYTSVEDLFQRINSNNIESSTFAANLLNQAAGISGLFPADTPAPTKTVKGTSKTPGFESSMLR